jgi:hypothetical protein
MVIRSIPSPKHSPYATDYVDMGIIILARRGILRHAAVRGNLRAACSKDSRRAYHRLGRKGAGESLQERKRASDACYTRGPCCATNGSAAYVRR